MNVLENISWKKMGDRVVAVDTGNGDYYTLNEVASTIWSALCENKSEEDIVAHILEEYDVEDAEKVRADIDAQLAQWKEMKLIA